jgi:hypothetical protein
MNKRLLAVLVLCCISSVFVWGQNSDQHDMATMPGMDKGSSETDRANGGSMGAAHAMHSMEGHHIEMGPHMKMTALRDPKPGDEERAAKIAETARRVAEKYSDYRVALKDGYQIFLPTVPQRQYHFTNRRNAIEAVFRFNPERPTSLLYEKQREDYKLIGLMYTAPKKASEDDLNKRIPLSVAQWHEHVNFCAPPQDRKQEMWNAHPRFGLAGSITTKEECEAAGGKFMPLVFNWMVHVYPFEQKPEDIWSAERQHEHSHGD